RNTRATALLFFVSVIGARTAAAQGVCLAVPPAGASAGRLFLTPAEDDAVITFRRLEAGTATGAEVSGDIRITSGNRSLIGERALVTQDRIDITGRVAYEGPEANVFGEDAVFDRREQSVFFGAAG